MAVAQGPFLAVGLLLVSSGLHCSSLPACPEFCTCQRAPLLNCSSSGLSLVPQRIQDSVTGLDLSHNLLDSVTLDRPHHNLRSVWLGNNSIAHLSLCIERNLGSHYVRGRHLHRLRPWGRRGCVSWAPTLHLLSVERNQLEQLPEGLEGSESLQVLQLSFNKISALQPGDLSNLRQLKELHLQRNLITSLHPRMFQDLAQLRILDLSFNMLTSLHPLMYLSLRNIGADVKLGGNRWQCDCSMHSLRRRMAYDSSRGLQAWSVVCSSPSIISGRDLLQLEEDDLNCFSTENRPEVHQDVTVYSGSQILLSCSTQDSMWWTPSGQASVSRPQAGLLISDITERDTGLYVCMSEEHEVASIFYLQISQIGGARRKTRSLPRTGRQIISQGTPNRIGQERNQRTTQSNLALAVSLSVFITFLIAFILGVLARPCLDVLWRRVTNRKSSSATNSVSSVQQRQYDNEGYSYGEEPEIGTHRERRVTFSTVDCREDSNVHYYDTIASGDQESINNDAVIECEAAEAEKDTHTAGDSVNENSLQQSSPEDNQKDGRDLSGVTVAGRTNNIEFEDIADPVELEERRSLSLCSDSSLPDKVFNEDQMTQRDYITPKSPQLADDSFQQRADFSTAREVEVSQISIEGRIEIPVFSSEPFANWSPHVNNTNLKDLGLWQENEEQFEFSDSVQSTSARSSSMCSFDDSKLIVAPTSDKQKRDDMSSSSSYVSGEEPTQYTVNSDQEEDIERNHNKPEVAYLKQDASLDQQFHGVDPVGPFWSFNQDIYRYDTQSHAGRTEHSFSSHSSDSDREDYTVKQEPHKGDGKDKSICVSDKQSSRTVTGEWDTREKVKPMPRTKWRVPILGVTSHGKGQDTKAPSPPAAHSSSSSSESEAEITKPQLPALDLGHVTPIKRCLDIRAPSPPTDSSSSSESTDETTDHMQKQGEMHVTRLQESQTVNNDSKTKWSALDHTTHIKRRLDIEAPSPDSDSSSSSEGEDKTGHAEKRRPGKVDIARLPLEESQTESHDPDTRWPALDLDHIPCIKRRLDIKAPSPLPDSFSNSEIVEEKNAQMKKHERGEVHVSRLPFEESQAGSNDPEIQWPALDLEHTMRIKRRLDIKAPSPPPDSSSHSDSEDETTCNIKKQEKQQTHMARLPTKLLQTESHDPKRQWPTLDLEHIIRIKRRLDIKAPSSDSDSSSSSDSEDKTTGHAEKRRPEKVDIAGLPLEESQTECHDPDTRWPALDLDHIPCIKRRLDIKAPSPLPDSFSNSEIVEEKNAQIKKHERGEVHVSRLPFEESQAGSNDPETQWPALDLEHTMRIKRRLDIKAPSPPPDSSSRSDSEDETTCNIKKQEKQQTHMARLPTKLSQTESHDPKRQWPTLDLEHIIRIKRRLDIKAPSSDSDSSSSSDSEDKTTGHAEKWRPGKVDIAGLPLEESQTECHDPDTRWPALDLDHIPCIKRRLDIKAPSPLPDSFSNSEIVEEKNAQIKKHERGEVHVSRLPFEESQAGSNDPETQWPALDLEHTMRIKRRLDIKAPSPPPDSSSRSDSEDETTCNIKKQEKQQTHMARLPTKLSQTESHDPKRQWPTLDLEHIIRIKRRLDIKAPSSDSDSSSSSDSEDKTTGHAEKWRPGKVDIAGLPLEESQTECHDPDTRWPALDLDHIPCIKRRLDIKAPSPLPDSFSNSEIVEEKNAQIKKHERGEVHVSRLPFEESQAGSNDPETQWPALDLEHTMRIKRRLDIKAPSPPPDSSSRSDSEDETTCNIKKQEKQQTHMARLPTKLSQTESHDPKRQWPTLDLEHIIRIKRRLDIKAPSSDSDSSSSSDSDDETTGHTEKQRPEKVDIAGLPLEESQTEGHDPDTKWPALDLDHIPRIKSRLDIKALSPPPHSSSSSDIEDETTNNIKKQEKWQTHMARLPFQEFQAGSHDPKTQWPALDLDHTTRIKRRLDIKAPSPDSDSYSSSDSETKTTGHAEKQRPGKVDIAGLPFEEYQTESHNPDIKWPPVNLGNITRTKRGLDLNAPSPPPDSLLSGGSMNHTVEGKRVEAIKTIPCYSSSSSDEQEGGMEDLSNPPTTGEPDPDSTWPELGLSSAPHIKRRLDIKAHSPPPESTSSSDESEGKLGLGVSKATERFFRSPKTPLINISRSPKTERTIKLEKYKVITDDVGDKTSDNIGTTPEINPELESRWATMNLGISRFRKHLEITSHTHEPPDLPPPLAPDSPSSSNNDSRSKSSRTRQKRRGVGMPGIIHAESKQTNKSVNAFSLKGQDDNSGNSVELKERLRIDHSLPATEEKSNPDTMLTGFGTPHFRRYLDIKISEKDPATPPLQQLPDSTSSSDNEEASTKHAGKGWRGKSQLPVVTDEEASQNHTSLYVAQALNIKLDQSQRQTEEVERNAGVKFKSQTKVVDESDSVLPHSSLTSIPHIRRALDIRAPLQREASSSSNSENETIDQSVPDLSLGVPQVKRCLNVKAQLPESGNSPSSCSESENEVTNMSGMTDNESLITYKRLIIKAFSPQSNSFFPSSQIIHSTNQRHMEAEMVTVARGPSNSVGDRNASLAPRRVSSLSFDDVLKKRIEQSRCTTDVDLPPEIRWTGVGSQLSDLSISSQRRHLDVGLSSSQQAPPAEPELPPPDSFNSSSSKSDDRKQDRGKANVTLMYKYSSLSASSVPLASSRSLDKLDSSPGSTNEILRAVSEDRMERKGLSGLKLISSMRRKWDTEDDNLDKGKSPIFDVHGSQIDTSFNYRRSEDIKPMAKQPLTQLHHSSSSVDERRSTDLVYGIPHYRIHDIEHIKPLQEVPPPIPASPPPDEVVGLIWRSPQSSEKQGLEGTTSYMQLSRNTEKSDPSSLTSQNLAVYFDSSNIKMSDV